MCMCVRVEGWVGVYEFVVEGGGGGWMYGVVYLCVCFCCAHKHFCLVVFSISLREKN